MEREQLPTFVAFVTCGLLYYGGYLGIQTVMEEDLKSAVIIDAPHEEQIKIVDCPPALPQG